MDLKITNNEDSSLLVQVEFTVFDWDELREIMKELDILLDG